MEREVNLYVFVVVEGGMCLKAGRLLSRNLHFPGAFEGFFRYEREYLENPASYPLDPIHLPLSEKTFKAARPTSGIHGVFEDSLPDAWGRRLLVEKAGLRKEHHAPVHLLDALGGGGLGALLYSGRDQTPAVTDGSIDFDQIDAALEEARRFETTVDPGELRFLLSGGTSAGGARPKVLVRHKETAWIAKFPSVHDVDPQANVLLEAAGLELGKRAGLVIPDFKVRRVRNRPVLLVRRFDVVPTGRRALLSFRSLLAVDDFPDFISYADLAEIVRRISAGPRADVDLLFKQMVVNVCLFNADDHLQNFSMVHGKAGWRLSPAYDLVPNVWREEQLLKINEKHAGITLADLLSEGREFGLSYKRALSLTEEVLDGMTGWEELLSEIPGEAAKGVRQRMRKRLQALSKGIRSGKE
jgi:serine/threonine-protein kinase HipA